MKAQTREVPGVANTGQPQRVSDGDFNGTSSMPEIADAHCRRCGRVLRSAKAVRRGTGWRCAARGGAADV